MKTLGTVLKTISSVMVALLFLFAFATFGVQLFGLRVYTVLSPSMEPEIRTGALVYVKPVDPQTLEKRDVITYTLSGSTTATHRIIEIPDESGALFFQTKGDNNDTPDATPVASSSVIGKVILDIPYLGMLVSYVQQPAGMYAMIAVVAGILIMVLWGDYLTESKAKNESQT